MNAIHERYADQGLVVLGVSHEPGKRLASWVEKRKVVYPVVSAPQGPSKYGVGAYPTYYLVSTSGKILAGPQHGKFSDGEIEAALRSVVIFPPVPESGPLSGLKRAVDGQKMAAIGTSLEKLSQDATLADTDRAAVAAVREAYDRMRTSAMEEVATLAQGPDYLHALERLAELQKLYKGAAVETSAAKQIAHIKKDPGIKRELTAQKRLAGLRKKFSLAKFSSRKKLKKALPGLIAKYKGTHAATKAEALLRRLEKMR